MDPTYKARREAAFIVVVNCGQAGRTCFCVSMETGPMAKAGYDLALTEILEDDRHEFLVDVGSERGGEVARELPTHPANDGDRSAAQRMVGRALAQIGRRMETAGIKGTALPKYEPSTVGKCRGTVPVMRQLHGGVSDVLLQHRRRYN